MEKILAKNKVARGGTELMAERINSLPSDLLSHFNIIHSRNTGLVEGKKNILVCHDLALDPMYEYFKDGGWQQFDKIVFVSYWQKQQFQDYLGVPPSASVVLKNAIEPIEHHEKPNDGTIRLMYYSTPHRGLDLLQAAFVPIAKEFPNVELNVYSSFDLYAWPERDKPYKELFDRLREHPKINYNKSVSNDEIRKQLKKNDILAYPSTWQETSCLVLMEAMSAGLTCVHSSLAALPETSMNLTMMYEYHEDPHLHAQKFYHVLRSAVVMHNTKNILAQHKPGLQTQKAMADAVYNWKTRGREWQTFLKNMLTSE
jgi:hypothetical protein